MTVCDELVVQGELKTKVYIRVPLRHARVPRLDVHLVLSRTPVYGVACSSVVGFHIIYSGHLQSDIYQIEKQRKTMQAGVTV